MTKKEKAEANKRGYENFVLNKGKNVIEPKDRGHILSTRKSGIRTSCFELGATEEDFYSFSNNDIVDYYDLLMNTVFISRIDEAGIKNARYSYRWYMHFKGIKHDPINNFGEISEAKKGIKSLMNKQNTIKYKEVQILPKDNELIPVANILLFRSGDGALYLKLKG